MASRNRNVVRLFLASPSDVSTERTVVEKVVAEINHTIASGLGIIMELVRWEDMLPDMGRPEQIILDQADIENTDIFVGILWNRFGSPTGGADSGTEEEFQVAYQAWQQNGKPRIMLYFCQRPANLRTEEELNQKAKTIKFSNQVSTLGLIREFENPEDFEAILRQDITNHLLRVERSSLPDAAVSARKGNGTSADRLLPHRVMDIGRMARVPAGEFLMGRTRARALIDYDFYIGTRIE